MIDFNTIKIFCMFIGTGRSGHSLVGALLDAHQNVVIPHEYNVLAHLRLGHFDNREKLFKALIKKSNYQKFVQEGGRTQDVYGKTGRKIVYKYNVPNQYQGTFEELQVIGDKMGGQTSIEIKKDTTIIDKLQDIVQIPIKFIHVTRNSYDNIARMGIKRKEEYFERMDAVKQMISSNKYPILNIKHESIIKNPKESLLRLCTYLDIKFDKIWAKDCASIVFDKPHKIRYEINWPLKLKQEVANRIKGYDFLKDYTWGE